MPRKNIILLASHRKTCPGKTQEGTNNFRPWN